MRWRIFVGCTLQMLGILFGCSSSNGTGSGTLTADASKGAGGVPAQGGNTSTGGAVDAGGDTDSGTDSAVSPGNTSIEFSVTGPDSYCWDSQCGEGPPIEIRDSSGTYVGTWPYRDELWCPPVKCDTCQMSVCPGYTCQRIGIAVTSTRFDWDGHYFTTSTCGVDTSCVASRYFPPGKYTARMCVHAGKLTGPDGGTKLCMTSGSEQCAQVEFDFPSSVVAKGTIGPCGTNSDPANCGACGNACAPVRLASGPSSTNGAGFFPMGGIGIDASSVYWGNYDGTVMKVPIVGGNPQTLASGQPGLTAIAVDATSVYWTTDGSVYWTTDGSGGTGTVMKVPIGGGTPTMLASWAIPTDVTCSHCGGIAVDATSVYWLEFPGTVMKVPIGGGAPTMLASGQNFPASIAVDAMNVYWLNYGGTDAVVMKVPIGGGTPSTLTSGGWNLVNVTPGSIAVDATSVYWTVNDVAYNGLPGGRVMKVALAGGPPTTLYSFIGYAGAVTIDATSVYWTDGTVKSMPLGGGTRTTLASAPAGGVGIAVDVTSVYWATRGGGDFPGTVMRFDKQACQSGVCKCPGSRVVCSDSRTTSAACVDTSSDVFNCGTCGTICAGGAACERGSCLRNPSDSGPG